MSSLEYPLGWKNSPHNLSDKRKRIILAHMMIPVYNLRNVNLPLLFYYDVLFTLSRRVLLN